MARWIRIIATPPGEAPEHIRAAWVGLALPLASEETEPETYATEVVMADFEEPGDHDVFRKVRRDFDAAGVKVTDTEIQTVMLELLGKAVEQIKSGR